MEIIARSRAAIKNAADFTPSVRPSRPLVTTKEVLKVVVPITLLGVSAVSCGPQPEAATPIAMETPRPINDMIAEQAAAGNPFQPYNTGESRKDDAFIQTQAATYGEFKGSTAMIGIDANNAPTMSEMFAFEKGVFIVFYDKDGKAVTDMSPVSVNYGQDNHNNLNQIYKADIGNGEQENIVPFLTLTSNTTLDMLDPEVLAKVKAGDQATLDTLIKYFDNPGEIIGLSYSNPITKQEINIESKTTPNWQDKIKNALQGLNPFAVTPVHAAPADTAVVESTATTPPPAINESVKTAVGENEYGEIATGAVKGKDYATGKDFDGTVEASSVKAVATSDTNFPNIVTAEAKDSSGKTFNVVWNPETNNWVKVTKVNTNLSDYTKGVDLQNNDVWNSDLLSYTNYTHFENIDKMVESGDFNLVLLAQGIGSEAFPANTEAPQYGLGINYSITGGPKDYFTYLDLMRGDFVIPDDKKDSLSYQEFEKGSFTKGNEPFIPLLAFEGNTSDNKNVIGFAQVFQNTDGTNFTVPLGFDPRQFLALFTANESVDGNGIVGMQRIIDRKFMLTPIIPTDNPNDWDNASKAGWGDGGNHLVSFAGRSFKNDVMIPMQTPGEGFKFIPAEMQQPIRDSIIELRNNGPKRSFLLPDGTVSPELLKFFSRNLNDAAVAHASW
jgi:hypothetical protein